MEEIGKYTTELVSNIVTTKGDFVKTATTADIPKYTIVFLKPDNNKWELFTKVDNTQKPNGLTAELIDKTVTTTITRIIVSGEIDEELIALPTGVTLDTKIDTTLLTVRTALAQSGIFLLNKKGE